MCACSVKIAAHLSISEKALFPHCNQKIELRTRFLTRIRADRSGNAKFALGSIDEFNFSSIERYGKFEHFDKLLLKKFKNF